MIWISSKEYDILISKWFGIVVSGESRFFSIAYLPKVAPSHFFVWTSIFGYPSIVHSQSRRCRVRRIDREFHRRIWQDCQELAGTICWFKIVSERSAHSSRMHTPEPVMSLHARKTIVAVVARVRTNDGQFAVFLMFLCVHATSYVDMSGSVIRVQMSACQDLQ